MVTLGADPDSIRVTWRLDGVTLDADERLCQIPDSIAGAPTLQLGGEVSASDDAGPVALTTGTAEDDEGGELRTWSVERPTSGPIEVAYVAQPVAAEPLAATPPLELRREGSGLSGAVKCFLLLPPGPDDLTFELRWHRPGTAGEDTWRAVTSLGEGDGTAGELAGTGLELLGDTYLMCGALSDRHHRDGELSTWWLTSSGIDVAVFSERLGSTYRLMSETFDAPAHPYRVFLRTHPHRGANASAHPASFVIALNPASPLDEASLHETLAHELVHEWLHLDGPTEDLTWFVEGSADYYSLVLPLRAGMIDEAAFLRAVNIEAREAYASVRRHLSIHDAQRVFFSDFLAHRLPYARGLFYLADLDARLREATAGEHGVDDVVRDLMARRRNGERIGVEEWCTEVGRLASYDERPVLDSMVFTGEGRPGAGCFGERFVMETVPVPVLDLGFDPSTLVTRRVRGLVPGGVADRAGLREGETVDLPRYPEIVALGVGEDLPVGVTRDGQTVRLTLPLDGETASVPQWSRASPGR